MYSICKQIIEKDALEKTLIEFAESERSFNKEIGVLDRKFYQCIQQPHLIWANTLWTSEGAHNKAAASIMKVRKDDRVAAAYFRPGLYFEIFANDVQSSNPRHDIVEENCVVVCHGIISDKFKSEVTKSRFQERISKLGDVPGLLSCELYFNNYAAQEFVAFVNWTSHEIYLEQRVRNERTIEEILFVGEKPYELSSYIQYEACPYI